MRNKWAHPIRIEYQMQHVARAFALWHVDETVEETRRWVGRHQHIPVSIHDKRRERLVLVQDTFQCFAYAGLGSSPL
jgi:hypothetical protein